MSETTTRFPRRHIFDLVGEMSVNADGSGRQAALREIEPGERIHLVRERDNPYDPNAILIVSDRLAVGIGHLAREDAGLWAPLIDAGARVDGRIHELTGGLNEYPSLGCRVSLGAAGKAFSPYRELRPEQVLYRHSPIWRQAKAAVQVMPKAQRRQKVGRGLLSGLLRGLFK